MDNEPQAWAKEPITHDGIWFCDANGAQLGTQDGWLDDPATIARMEACYNACAGVPTEALERMQCKMDDIKMILYEEEIFSDPAPGQEDTND